MSRALFDEVAAAVAVPDDGFPRDIADAGDVEEALYWLMATIDEEGKSLPAEQAKRIADAFPMLADAVAAVVETV